MNEAYAFDRTEELQYLNSLVTDGVRLINITGEAGIGKTVLMQLFVKKYGSCFISVTFADTCEMSFIDFFAKLKAAESEKSLIIIDNIDFAKSSWAEIVRTLKPKAGITIFVVSRKRIVIRDDECLFAEFQLKRLSRNQVFAYCCNAFSNFLEKKHFDDFYRITHGSPLFVQLLSRLIIDNRKNGIEKLVGLQPAGFEMGDEYHPERFSESMLQFFSNNPENLKTLTQNELESIVASQYENSGYLVQAVGILKNKDTHIYHAVNKDEKSFMYIVDCDKDSNDKRLKFQVIFEAFGLILSGSENNEIYAIGKLFDEHNRCWKLNDFFAYPISLETFTTIKLLLNNNHIDHADL